MKIQMLETVVSATSLHKARQIYQVDAATAKDFAARGLAVLVRTPKQIRTAELPTPSREA